MKRSHASKRHSFAEKCPWRVKSFNWSELLLPIKYECGIPAKRNHSEYGRVWGEQLMEFLCLLVIRQAAVDWLAGHGTLLVSLMGSHHSIWNDPCCILQNHRCELHWTPAYNQVVCELVNIVQLPHPDPILWKMNAISAWPVFPFHRYFF